MTTNALHILGTTLGDLPVALPDVLAQLQLKTDGSLAPVIIALVFTLILAWGAAYGLACLRSPSRIRRCLINKGMGLPELREELRLGAGTFLLAIAVSLLVTIAIAVLFYATLYQQSYMSATWWVPLTSSWLSSDTLFLEYRPMPWGVLLAVFSGWIAGQMIGIYMGRRKGAAGILLTSRLHNPLKA